VIPHRPVASPPCCVLRCCRASAQPGPGRTAPEVSGRGTIFATDPISALCTAGKRRRATGDLSNASSDRRPHCTSRARTISAWLASAENCCRLANTGAAALVGMGHQRSPTNFLRTFRGLMKINYEINLVARQAMSRGGLGRSVRNRDSSAHADVRMCDPNETLEEYGPQREPCCRAVDVRRSGRTRTERLFRLGRLEGRDGGCYARIWLAARHHEASRGRDLGTRSSNICDDVWQ
jgi:hypothetical protein